jgi:hypothetical protein
MVVANFRALYPGDQQQRRPQDDGVGFWSEAAR